MTQYLALVKVFCWSTSLRKMQRHTIWRNNCIRDLIKKDCVMAGFLTLFKKMGHNENKFMVPYEHKNSLEDS